MMSNQFKMVNEKLEGAVIKVIGVGGGGCNAIDYMVEHGVWGVEFIAANTDAQALESSRADIQLRLGEQTTRGLGAGMNPEVGTAAALEAEDRLRELLEGTDMLFITAGMGGGTGTGAAPVVARLARELDILCVGVVTRPFAFEQNKRAQLAEQGIGQLLETVDSMIAINNQRLMDNPGLLMAEAFRKADEVLHGAVRGVAELITRVGYINVDFADVRAIMKSAGTTIIGNGSGSGSDAGQDAVSRALSCPLLEDHNLEQAQGILCNTTVSEQALSIDDFRQIGERMEELASKEAKIITGLAYDNSLEDEVRVTVVATGFCGTAKAKRPSSARIARGPSLRQAAGGRAVLVGGRPDYSCFEDPPILRKQVD